LHMQFPPFVLFFTDVHKSFGGKSIHWHEPSIMQKQRSRSTLNFQLSDKLGIANPTALLGFENLI
jgi:hypothetical protein